METDGRSNGHISDVGVADLRFAKTAEDLAHIKSIEDVGVVIVPEHLAGAIGHIRIEDVGSIAYVPVGENVNCMTGQIRMTGEALAAGPPESILVVIGQFMVSSIPKEVGYKEIRVIGQLMAPRGSESVLGAKLTQVNGQTIYLPENARMVFGEERIGRQFLGYLDDRTAFVVFGNLTFESDVDADSLREKVSELVVLGDVEGPKELVPLLQVLARERYGNIRASG